VTLRRLRWLLAPLLAIVALAVLVLPPRPLPEKITLLGAVLGLEGRQWRQDVQDEHRLAIERSRDRVRDAIHARSHGAADVLAAASPRALRSADGLLVVVRDLDVPDTAARAWLRVAERELALVPPADTRGVPVVVALHTKGPVGVYSAGSETLRDRFQFEAGPTRACIVDIVFPRGRPRGQGRFEVPRGISGGVLGRCALYARYGFPGAGVRDWAGLAPYWSGRWWWWYGDESVFDPRRQPPDTVRYQQEWGGVPWAELGCLRGRDEYCASLAGLSRDGTLPRGWNYPYYYYYGGGADRLPAELILQRGADRFVRFWSSDLVPDSALHLVYGVPAGALARELFARRFVAEPSVQPGAARLLVAFGWVVALGALAMALAWRREMDV
jgi:hypothetical protein